MDIAPRKIPLKCIGTKGGDRPSNCKNMIEVEIGTRYWRCEACTNKLKAILRRANRYWDKDTDLQELREKNPKLVKFIEKKQIETDYYNKITKLRDNSPI